MVGAEIQNSDNYWLKKQHIQQKSSEKDFYWLPKPLKVILLLRIFKQCFIIIIQQTWRKVYNFQCYLISGRNNQMGVNDEIDQLWH